MKIRMTKDSTGSPDGIEILNYAEGETYDVPEDLAAALIAEGVAEDMVVITRAPSVEDANKGRGRKSKATAPPENK